MRRGSNERERRLPAGRDVRGHLQPPSDANVIVFDMQDEYFEYTYNYGHPAKGCDYDNLTVNEVNKVDAEVVLITSLYLAASPPHPLNPHIHFHFSVSPPPRLIPPFTPSMHS